MAYPLPPLEKIGPYAYEFHPDLIWNDGTVDVFEEVAPRRTRRIRRVAIRDFKLKSYILNLS